MGRKKIEFTDNINFRISQLIEVNKSVREIKEDLLNNFDFNINEETLRLKLKSLGYDKKDCRKKKSKHAFDFTDEHKAFIQMMSENGMSLLEMHNLLKKDYDIEVSHTTINNLIKKEGYVRGSRYEFDWYDEDDDSEDEVYEQKDIEQIGRTLSDNPKYDGLVDKLVNDVNFRRYCQYEKNTPYNYEGEGERKGLKDTWFTRDGFLKINTAQNMYIKEDGYEMLGGSYRSKFELEDDLKFYTFVRNEDRRGRQVFEKRVEIKKWYEKHRQRINELYDFIVTRNYASTINEINEFNEICRELYNKKIEFIKVLAKENPMYAPAAKNILGCMKKDLQFTDFKTHMMNLGLFTENSIAGEQKVRQERFL